MLICRFHWVAFDNKVTKLFIIIYMLYCFTPTDRNWPSVYIRSICMVYNKAGQMDNNKFGGNKLQEELENPYVEEEQTTTWPTEKVQEDNQRSTKHTHNTKDRVTRTPLKTWGERNVFRIDYHLCKLFNIYI